MSDFFAELEEDIREERLYTLWNKYGNYIIGLALAIVLATVGYSLWNYFRKQNQQNAYMTYSQALDLMHQGKKEKAIKAFQNLAKDGGGYGKLAQLFEASLLPNPEALYTQISQENAMDPALSNLAKILMAARSLNNPASLASIDPLTAPNNAWAPLSLELLAFSDLKRGDEAKAAERYLHILKEPHTTSDEQTRVGMMLSQIDIPASLIEKFTQDMKDEDVK
jgi:hypothetical protein